MNLSNELTPQRKHADYADGDIVWGGRQLQPCAELSLTFSLVFTAFRHILSLIVQV